MKKHNGHSTDHGKSKARPVPSGLQATLGENIPPALTQTGHVLEHGDDQPAIGRTPHPWETVWAEPRPRHAELPARPVLKADASMAYAGTQARAPAVGYGHRAKALTAAVSESPGLSRILLQPTILKSVPIGDNGEQGIGLHVREGGVIVQMEPWSPMQVGDRLDLFWGAPDDPQSPGYPGTPVAGKTLQFPEEVNKAVLLTVPEDDVVAGWINVVCRVTRAGSGFQELSPLLPVLVKLDPPGGVDPAPDENPNLAAPNLPDEVIRNGVDTSWAARGVPVMIQPYPNMAVGDRIRLNWGGAFVEYTLRDSSEVNLPVMVVVNDATIRAAGDGDAVVLRYQVFDLVGNRSGWSPTTEVVVDVQGNALFLPEVTNADDNGVIDLAQLGGEDVRVLVTAFAPDFAVGDTVTLQWVGHTAEGVLVPYEEAQDVTRGPVQTLEFFVPNASVVALAQGDAVVSYRLQSGRSSKQVRVTIVGEAAKLPAPTVDEAPNDYDELDATLSRATVRIPPYPGMDAGDVVTLIWSGMRADGESHVYSFDRTISGSAVGKEVVLQVPGAEIALLAGGTVEVWYEVMIGDGTPLRPSLVRTLRVSDTQGVTLPAPTVDEAPDNVTLDPDAVGLYAEVRIEYDKADGDRVDMDWIGSSGPGGSFSDWINIRAATVNKPVLFDVDKAYVIANDGGTVTIRYTVTPKVGSPRPSASRTLRVGAAQDIIPAITSVRDSKGEILEGGVTEDTTVTLSGTATPDTTVELFDNDTISHGIVDVNSAGVWTRAVTGLADGNHRFTAKGLYGSEPVSLAWNFRVAVLVALTAPIVIEADPFTDTLNLVKPVDAGVHIVIDYDGMEIGDTVTMIWQGTDGGGSDTQPVEVTTPGPLLFTVSSATIAPNYNKTVRIFYTVLRKGQPEESTAESSSLDLAIQNLALQGTATFAVGTTSFYRCTTQSIITIPDDLPVGAVIETTPASSASAQTSTSSSTLRSYYRINLVGSEPKDDSTLFPTSIPGVGFRLIYTKNSSSDPSPLTAGPISGDTATTGNSGTTGAIQFVKTGPIASGARLSAGVMAQWLMGSNRLYYMGWQLLNDLTIHVTDATLIAPVVTEADPFTDTLNLVKPVDGVHVVIDYADMAIGDTVTMIWEGAAGAGSQQQAVKIETLGPIFFTVGNTVITPNNNKTVEIYYTVKRAGTPEAPPRESLSLSLAIQAPALQGNVTFVVGTTSFYRCTARSSITIPEDLPVGAVIETTPTAPASAQTSFTCSTSYSSYLINQAGGEPKDSSVLFPTGIAGVGFRCKGTTNDPHSAGPKTSAAGTYGNGYDDGTSGGAIEFVKTGPITRGTLSAGVLAQWLCGSNRLYYMGWQLMNDVTIDVVRRSSTGGKRRTAMTSTAGAPRAR
ncbi:Ig-like domain-containing protein [Dyella nitratireducens]|uniref:Ig-like domain-containing protein n=1 Tax=Dyella nitratireducens TaxID=1849580 RepID=A0ABQ1FLS8_9GAMM|nr:Ig-like domain-containing protein [Dyella nitratireducens]GGA18833.1 hypothetical protein GCM10010981_03370 [Dyella nitratireducens]GLQ44602.1 hypothetical protein GCM10007902_44520 [Dyella nitratireducens]